MDLLDKGWVQQHEDVGRVCERCSKEATLVVCTA